MWNNQMWFFIGASFGGSVVMGLWIWESWLNYFASDGYKKYGKGRGVFATLWGKPDTEPTDGSS